MKSKYISEPSEETQAKIRKAIDAIADQKSKTIKCPYCQRKVMHIFEDTTGHVKTKCTRCGQVLVINVLDLRRAKQYRKYK